MPTATRSTASASPRERILAYLARHGGRVESPDGLGLTATMAAATGYDGVTALNAMLVRLEREGLIKRVVRGKRTLSVSLAGRRTSAKRTAGTTTRPASSGRASGPPATRRAVTRRAGRDGGTSVAEELASLSRDIEALARKVRHLQKAVAS